MNEWELTEDVIAAGCSCPIGGCGALKNPDDPGAALLGLPVSLPALLAGAVSEVASYSACILWRNRLSGQGGQAAISGFAVPPR